MDETKVTALLEQLFIHVASMPWKDSAFIKSEVAKQAAQDQIVGHITREIINLYEESKNDQA